MGKNINLKNYYKTSDLALAATLTLFFPIIGINKLNSFKFEFLFRHNEHIQKLIQTYWQGDIKVEPQSYFNSIKRLKNMIYNH